MLPPLATTSHSRVVLFYKYFVPEECPRLLSQHSEFYVDKLLEFQKDICTRLGLKGRILLSSEGINGTVSGRDRGTIQEYISTMDSFDLQDCGLPGGIDEVDDDEGERRKLFRNIDWKESTVDDGLDEPFPDLKVSVVKEIVSTGGLVKVDDIPEHTGKHLSPEEWHRTLVEEENVVLIDVRNTFEHDIGHFVIPKTGEVAMNPEMVTFSSFDSNFCAKNADKLKHKKVLMYCTGGIRCEKASVMLRNRGVQDVNQLQGGIHRYLEHYGNDGFYKGLNFVFDQRVAMKPNPIERQNAIVGKCVECKAPFDEICGSRVCTVCRDLVLVCPNCQSVLREYHCKRHESWKNCYYTFLEVFDKKELIRQKEELNGIRDSLVPASSYKNIRRTLARQMDKITKHIEQLDAGKITLHENAPRRCRTCMEPSSLCDGRCWGFWKTKAKLRWEGKTDAKNTSSPLPVAVGDRIEPGENWNVLRLGDKTDANGVFKKGTVVEIKSWAGDEKDCVAVLWDDMVPRGRNQGKVQPQIYRWGVLALDGTRMYDVCRIP